MRCAPIGAAEGFDEPLVVSTIVPTSAPPMTTPAAKATRRRLLLLTQSTVGAGPALHHRAFATRR